MSEGIHSYENDDGAIENRQVTDDPQHSLLL